MATNVLFNLGNKYDYLRRQMGTHTMCNCTNRFVTNHIPVRTRQYEVTIYLEQVAWNSC